MLSIILSLTDDNFPYLEKINTIFNFYVIEGKVIDTLKKIISKFKAES